MRLLVLLVGGAAEAAAQGTEATLSDGRGVLLYDDGTWLEAGAAAAAFRDGPFVASRTGAYGLHVPAGWVLTKGKGRPADGEFALEHAATGAVAFVSHLSPPDLGLGDLAVSAMSGIAMFWSGMSGEAAVAERGTPRHRLIGGRRFASLDGAVRYPYEPTLDFQITVHTDERGMLALLTLVEPAERDGARAPIDALHRGLVVLGDDPARAPGPTTPAGGG